MADYDLTYKSVLNFRSENIGKLEIATIDDTHFAIISSGDVTGMQVKAYSMNSDGTNVAEVGSLTLDSTHSYYDVDVKLLDDDKLVCVYNVTVATILISSTYTLSLIDSMVYYSGAYYYRYCTLGIVNSTHFLIHYYHLSNYGTAKWGLLSMSVDANGDTITQVDSDTTSSTLYTLATESVLMFDETYGVLSYGGSGGDGYLLTFSLDASYNITLITRIEHDTGQGATGSTIILDDTHIFMAYGNGDAIGKTFEFSSSYSVITQIDSVMFSTSYSTNVFAVAKLDDFHVATTYMKEDTSELAITVQEVDSSFDNITELNSQLCYNSTLRLNNVSGVLVGNVFVVAYDIEGSPYYGYLETYLVKLPTDGGGGNFLQFFF